METNTDEPVQRSSSSTSPMTFMKSSSSTSPMTIRKLFRQTQTSPMVTTPVQNRFQLFDMAAGDTPMEAAEEAVHDQLEVYRQREAENTIRISEESRRMLQALNISATVIEPRRLDFMDPMTVNTEGEQHKREAETPPTSTKKKKKKGSKSELLEIGDNPEEAHEPKGPVGRPKGSAKSSSSSSSSAAAAPAASSSSSSSAAAAPAASSSSASAGSQQVPIKKTVDKPHGVKKDTSKSKNYWKRQNIQYLYEQLQLDGMRFTAMQKTGKEDVLDPALGRKVQKKGDKLVKNDLLEMLYKSRNII